LGLVILNLLLAITYWKRTYPGAKIQNINIGSQTKAGLEEKLSNTPLLPSELEFTHEEKEVVIKPSELGVEVDSHQTAQQAVSQKSWLPMWNLVRPRQVGVVLKTNNQKFNGELQRLADIFRKDPVDAKVVLENNSFDTTDEVNGYELDKSKLLANIQSILNNRSHSIAVPVTVTQPKVKKPDLMATLQDLRERQNVSITYRFKDQARKLTPAEIGSLHESNGTNYVLSEVKIRDFVIQIGRSFGIGVQNINDAVRDTKSAIQNKKTLDFTFKEAPRKTYSYCVSLRGVSDAELSGFQNKIASVLNAASGWSLDNRVAFVKVDSGCNFRVWLSDASQMPSFGAICDSMWSCAVSPNVIINYDRWRNASTAWNNAGGSLEDYRAMVINHEVGHWLGFGHLNCGGAGQLAPVMQQQSINL
jgi:hypothetical protein